MKALLFTLLFGKDDLTKLFASLLKQRSAVRKLRSGSAALEAEADTIRHKQTQNTTDLKAAIMSHNDTRAALTKSFDL